MEISFHLDWASFLVGLVSGVIGFFAVMLVVAYRMKKSELNQVYKKKK